MLHQKIHDQTAAAAMSGFLQGYSAEVTTRDTRTVQSIAESMPAGSEIFIASLPKEPPQRLIETARQLAAAGMRPVPHLVARSLVDKAELDSLLGAFAAQAGVDKVLVLAGDRDKPEGEFGAALDLLVTGLLNQHGIGKVFLSAYPEGHPRIADVVLDAARADKLAAAAAAGLEVELVSQFCFEAGPVVAYAEALRAAGVSASLRVGVAGPANRKTLIKYAMMCGVGPSLRALKERKELAANMLARETPQAMLADIARAAAERPGIGLSGVHVFPFGSLETSAAWANGVLD